MAEKKVTKKATTKAVTKKAVKKAVKKTDAKTTTKKVVAKKTAKKATITAESPKFYDMVGKKAYELFEASGYAHGNDQGNWYEAERLVREELGL